MKKNSKFVFNKIFTGGFLVYNLGHEVKNFIKTDNKERYIYLNPWGDRNSENIKNLEYVIHFMHNKNRYELIAVSKIDTEAKSIYNKDPKKEKDESLTFEGLHFSEIFSNDKGTAHLYSFKASNFYKPKDNFRIFLHFRTESPSEIRQDGNVVDVYVKCFTNHSITYSKEEDDKILEELFQRGYLEEKDENIVLNNIDDEQCFAVISDRTHLEDSISNQIAYFLSRDKKNRLKAFCDLINEKVKNNLNNSDKIEEDEYENFKIIREKKGIDLLLESDKHVIVIENKIDSYINGIKDSNDLKKESQLSKYYEYIMKDKDEDGKDESFRNIDPKNRLFFILEPEYSLITREKLDNEFKNGEDYILINYRELHNALQTSYEPFNDDSDKQKRKFLYDQFLQELEYANSSIAEQNQKVAYIRFKQRINELKNSNK